MMGRPDAGVIASLADELAHAEATRRPVEPLTDRFPDLSLADAYRIQRYNIDRRLASGARVAGHKIGFTAQAMRDLLGVDEPDFGHILDDMVLPDGASLQISDFLYPRMEAEIVFVLKSDLKGPGITAHDVLDAVDHTVASFELIDSRVVDWRIRLADTVADNASASRVIVGGSPRPLAADHFVDCRVDVSVDGTPVSRGYGRDVYGSPVAAVVWLVNLLSEYDVGLEAGHLVMPGSLHSAVTITGPCSITADFSGLGSVTAHFSGSREPNLEGRA